MEKKKSVGVLFSGGLDSTYLIWKNLKEGNRVIPIYIEIENNKDKVKLEKNRIELLVDLFRKKISTELIDFIRYPIVLFVQGTSVSDLPQVPIWITGLLYSQKYDISEIQIAYVMNDDAISYLDEIKAIYGIYNKIISRQVSNLKPLKFPLKRVSKYEMLDELPTEFLDLVVSCEAPRLKQENDGILDYDPCGYCEACKKVLSVYNKMVLPEKYLKVIKEKSIDNLSNVKDIQIENDYNSHLIKIYIPSPNIAYDEPKQEPRQLSLDFELSNVKKFISNE